MENFDSCDEHCCFYIKLNTAIILVYIKYIFIIYHDVETNLCDSD
jgi:hypothetical protein